MGVVSEREFDIPGIVFRAGSEKIREPPQLIRGKNVLMSEWVAGISLPSPPYRLTAPPAELLFSVWVAGMVLLRSPPPPIPVVPPPR